MEKVEKIFMKRIHKNIPVEKCDSESDIFKRIEINQKNKEKYDTGICIKIIEHYKIRYPFLKKNSEGEYEIDDEMFDYIFYFDDYKSQMDFWNYWDCGSWHDTLVVDTW